MIFAFAAIQNGTKGTDVKRFHDQAAMGFRADVIDDQGDHDSIHGPECNGGKLSELGLCGARSTGLQSEIT